MKLQTLIEKGALVQTPPTPREVTWTPTDPQGNPLEPVTFTVYVRAPSSGWLDRARTAAARAGADRISYRSAILSHALVFGEKLDEHFTYEQADLLKDDLADALMAAYNAVNAAPPIPEGANGRDEFAKNSEPMPGSGTNSSEQVSADEASPPPANH
jgi:hypothetical protein